MPNGLGGVLSAIFDFSIFILWCQRILSIATAESKDPEQKIKRATNLVLYRVILIFCGFNFYNGCTGRLAFTAITTIRHLPICLGQFKCPSIEIDY